MLSSLSHSLFSYSLRLVDILVRPMQRLTKYSLLLAAIRKHITDENDAEIMDAMVSIIFLDKINIDLQMMKQIDASNRMCA